MGVIIAVGKQTRIKINSKLSKKKKHTTLDIAINYSTIAFFVAMVLLSIINTIFLGWNKDWYINMFRYFSFQKK